MQLYAVCLDVFAAGQEKGTTTLRWAMLLLAANQEIQVLDHLIFFNTVDERSPSIILQMQRAELTQSIF